MLYQLQQNPDVEVLVLLTTINETAGHIGMHDVGRS
jgi:hypothetical protein